MILYLQNMLDDEKVYETVRELRWFEGKVKCPHCKKKFNYHESEFRPFCSDQCKMIDMGSWLNESYSIAGRTNSVYIEDPDALKNLLDDSSEDY